MIAPDGPDDARTQIALDRTTRPSASDALESTQIASRTQPKRDPDPATRLPQDKPAARDPAQDVATDIAREKSPPPPDDTGVTERGLATDPAKDLARNPAGDADALRDTKIGDRKPMTNEYKPTPTQIVGFGSKPSAPPAAQAAPSAVPSAAPPAEASAQTQPAVPPDSVPAAAGQRVVRADQIPVVGWLVVVKGLGRGHACEIGVGMNYIGRGHHNRIVLDFGDGAISRERAGGIAFDPLDSSFVLVPGEGNNFVRHNDKKVLVPQELATGDRILIGQTELRFVPLCGPDFSWEQA